MKVLVLLTAVVCVYGMPNVEYNKLVIDTEDVYCTACQDILKDLRLILQSNRTQTLVEKFLEDKVCIRLGESAALCRQYVKTYAPVLFQFLGSELDSLKLCSKLGLCPAQPEIKQPVVPSPLFSLAPSKPVKKDMEESFGMCFICKMILEKLYADLGQHATQAEIEAYLDKVCNIIPHAFRSECVSLINEFTPTIIKLVMKKMSPKQICVEIRLCSSKAQSNNSLHNLFYISKVN